MFIDGKYVNIVTGEIIGYRIQNGDYKVALSEKKIKELDIEGCDYLQFIDVPTLEVVSSGNKLYLYSGCICEDSNIPDKVEGTTVWVDGYCFNKYSGVEIDSDYAINSYLDLGGN